MNKRLFTTPEGVRDIYDGECKRKLDLEAKLRAKLHLYGFEDIETPCFEFKTKYESSLTGLPSAYG